MGLMGAMVLLLAFAIVAPGVSINIDDCKQVEIIHVKLYSIHFLTFSLQSYLYSNFWLTFLVGTVLKKNSAQQGLYKQPGTAIDVCAERFAVK